MQSKSNPFLSTLFGLFLLFFVNIACAAFTFPGSMPSGCTGSGGNYSCSGSVTFNDHVNFTDNGNVTVTINGGLTINNYTIGSNTDNANVTFIVNGTVTIYAPTIYANINAGSHNIDYQGNASTSGSLTTTTGNISTRGVIYGPITTNSGDITVNPNNTSIIWGEITIKDYASSLGTINIGNDAVVHGSIYNFSTSSSSDVRVVIGARVTVNGSIIAISKDFTDVDIGDDAIINGDITAFGDDSSEVRLSVRSRVNGNVKSNAVDIDDGDVDLAANSRVTGNITAFGDINNYGQINGCAHSTYTSGTNISLHSGSTNSGGSCCGASRSSCNSSCVSNSSGTATSLCGATETVVVSASGQQANGVWPIMELWVNQVKVDSVVVNSATTQNYTFNVNLPANNGFRLDLVFPNDAYVSNSEDRNLIINSINYRSKTILSTGTSVIRDWGNNSTEYFDGIGTDVPNVMLHSNGAMRFSTAELIAYYNLEDPTVWNGATNETKDKAGFTGGPFDGQGIGAPKPTPTTASPAKSGTNGTCGYANFTDSNNDTNGSAAFTLDDLPLNTANGAKTTVSFWMYWNGTNSVMPIGWNRYDLYFYNSHFGFNTDNVFDVYGTSSAGLANGWHHVVAVFTNGSVTSNKLYIDGVNKTLTQLAGSPNNALAVVQPTLQVSGWTTNTIYRFNGGRIDEVKVYNGDVTQAQVTADYNATHDCTNAGKLEAHYKFDEETWSRTAPEVEDSSVNNFNATLATRSGTAKPTIGFSNPALSGSNGTCNYGVFNEQQYVSLPPGFPNLSTNLTISAWFNTSDVNKGNQRIISDDANNNGGYLLTLNANGNIGKLKFSTRGTVAEFLEFYHTFENNKWYFVAARVNASTNKIKLYLYDNNGALINSQEKTAALTTSDNGLTSIGAEASGSEVLGFVGALDEIKLYSKALSDAEITALSQERHACPTYGKLEAYYQFDEESWSITAPEAKDISGNNFHATLATRSGTAKPTIGYKTPALSGASGTCNYGVFTDQQLVSLPASFPSLNTNFTLSAWFNTANANQATQRIISDDAGSAGGAGTTGYALTLNDNGEMNKLKFFTRSPSIVAEINHAFQSNTWYYTAVSINASTNTVKLYLYNAAGGLISSSSVSGSSSAFDNGLTSIGAEPIGSAEVRGFNGFLDEIRLYSKALSDAEIATLSQERHACIPYNYNEAASDFNCVIPNGDSKTGRLYTQLAGTAFNFDVLARNTNGDVETGFADQSNQTVTVEFVDSTNYATATACVANSPATSAIVTQSITFLDADNGRKLNQTATINSAYKNLRCRVKEGATIKGCSQDNFAVRPSSFTISSSNANADSNPSANPNRNENATTVFKAALDHFNLTANTNTVGYDGKPMIRTPADLDKGDVYSWASGAAPLNNYALAELSRTLGSVTGEFSNANISNGNAVGNTFKYTEVGYFRFQPHSIVDTTFTAVDQAGGDCTADYSNTLVNGKYGCNIGHNHNGSRTAFFGRFIPAYFTISPSTTTPACNSFTYYGQDGLSTTFTITARNGDGNTTINYTNNAANEGEIYGKLNLSAPANFHFTSSSGAISSSSITSAGSWIRGEATVTAKHTITRTNTLTAPTDIKIFAKPTDSDLVTMPASTAVSTDSPFRYGRLKVSNAYGSELLPLSIPIEAQYWDGTNYRRNTLDGCTNISTTDVSLGNYKKNLSTDEIALSGGGAMNAGKSKFTLSKPSEVNKGPGAGNNGSVDINFNLLNFPWLGSGTQAARATFGLYKSPIIYMRENY